MKTTRHCASPICTWRLEHSLQFLRFPLLTFSFLEVGVNSSFQTFLMPLYRWRFSLGLSPVTLLTFFTCTVGTLSPLLGSTESDLAETHNCFTSQQSVCLHLYLCMGNKAEFLFLFMIFVLSAKRCQFTSLLLRGRKPLLIDVLRIF